MYRSVVDILPATFGVFRVVVAAAENVFVDSCTVILCCLTFCRDLARCLFSFTFVCRFALADLFCNRWQEVNGNNLEAWEKAHHDLLTLQVTYPWFASFSTVRDRGRDRRLVCVRLYC